MKTTIATFARRAAAAIALLMLMASAAHAEYPDRTITWVVGYPAGGGSDFIARLIGSQLSANLGQQVIIDNRPGASGNLGAAYAARAPADGYTLLSVDSSLLISNKALFKKLSFDPDKDFIPLSLTVRVPLLLVVNNDLPVKTAQDLFELAKAQNGNLTFASPGLGSPHQLALEALKRRVGFEATHVPYKGSAPAVTDLVGGTVKAMMLDLSSAQQFIKIGKLHALAVGAPDRLKALPELPSFADIGLSGLDVTSWQGVAVPIGVPPAIVEKLHDAIRKAVESPDVSRKLQEAGLIPITDTVAEFQELIRADSKVWRDLIVRTGISLD